LCALALALLLSLRLLAPAGFMPAFDHGRVTIVACPDAGPAAAPIAGHHHGHPKKLHQPCPYASASSPGALPDFGPLLYVLILGAAALMLGRTFLFIERDRAQVLPPSTGPPLSA
jgi:hypothetical protein